VGVAEKGNVTGLGFLEDHAIHSFF
jgi:hypothetical protein